MAITNGYATEQQIRDQFAETGTVFQQAMIERAVNAASRAIDRYCGYPLRKFWLDSSATARTYRPDDPDLAWVADIGSATGLLVKTDTTGDGTFATTWTIATDFELEPLDADKADASYAWWRIRAVGTKTFPTGTRRAGLQVTAKWGWSAVPDQVAQACIIKSSALVKRKDSPQGVAGFGDFGVVRISRRDHDVCELLDEFTRNQLGAV